MKNLKKVLALVLVVAMMASFATVSAAFPDADAITYTTAVDALTNLGVISGYTDGTFRPANNVNRGAMAKMVAYVMNGGVNAAASYGAVAVTAFNDVDTTNTFANSIGYVVSKGIVSGYADGTFRAGNPVTGVAAAKMLLGALGYNAEIEGYENNTNWKMNVINDAEEAGLFKGMATVDLNANLSREAAAQMIWNALQATMVKYSSTGTTITAGDITITAGAVIEEVKNDAATESFKNDDKMQLVEKCFPTLAAASKTTDAFGRPGVEYLLNSKTPVATIIETPTFVYVNEFSTAIQADLVKAGYTGFDTAEIAYNGGNAGQLLSWYKTDAGGAANGFRIEIFTDVTKAVTKIVVIEQYFAVVGKTTAAKGETPASIAVSVYPANSATPVSMTVVDNPKATTDMFDVLAAYGEKAAIAVVAKPGWDANTTKGAEFILAAEATTSVAGAVTKYTSGANRCLDKVYIGGVGYELNNAAVTADGIAVSSLNTGTLYLDAQGKAIGWIADTAAETVKPVVFVVNYYKNVQQTVDALTGVAAPTTTYWALCVNTAGEIVSYQVDGASVAKIGADATSRDINAMATIEIDETNTTAKATLYKFTAINTKTTAETKTTDLKIDGNNYYTEDVKFIYVSGSMAKTKVEVKAGVQAVAAGSTKWYEAKAIQGDTTNKTTSYVFVNSAYTAADVTVTGVVYAAEAANSATKVLWTDKNGDEQVGYEHTVYVDGVETTVVTASEGKLSGFITLTEVVPGVYTASSKSAANLLVATDVTNMYNGLLSTKDITDISVAGATLVDVSGDKDATTDATKLTAEYDVALVMSADGKTIVTIYITDYTKALA